MLVRRFVPTLKLIFLSLFINGLLSETVNLSINQTNLTLISKQGLQRAEALIKQPISLHKQTNDVVLSGLTDQIEEAAYKLQILRIRIGQAWELVFTDYGFVKLPSGIDLINHKRKIAVELKNGYRINSIVKREDLRRLREFKSTRPRYTVILGFINDKTLEGRSHIRNNVHIMTGKRFLKYIFKGHEKNIISHLRESVRTVSNGLIIRPLA